MSQNSSHRYICSSCGHENYTGANFCSYCGASLQPQLYCPNCGRKPSQDETFCPACGACLATAPPKPSQAPPARPAVEATTVTEVPRPIKPNKLIEALPSIQKESRFTEETDRQMSFWGNLFGTVALILLGVVGGLIWSCIFHYRLIERQNRHFARKGRFYKLIAEALLSQGEDSGNESLIATAGRMEVMVNEATAGEPRRNPWLWGVIIPVLIPVIPVFYTYWFLMNDLRRHTLRQVRLTEAVTEGLQSATGEPFAISDDSVVPHRRYWLYLLLLPLLFISIFILIYRIFEDPNKYFTKQRRVEDTILSCLSRAGVVAR